MRRPTVLPVSGGGDPVPTQHCAMLKQNVLYAGDTRGKPFAILTGQNDSVAIAVCNSSGRLRWSKLDEWLADAETGVASDT